MPRNESLPLEDSARLGLEASSKLAVLDLRLLTDTAIGTDDGVFNSRTEFYTINDHFAIFIGYNLLFLNCYEIPDHTVIQFGPLANHAMPSNDTFLDTRLFSDPRALPKHTIR